MHKPALERKWVKTSQAFSGLQGASLPRRHSPRSLIPPPQPPLTGPGWTFDPGALNKRPANNLCLVWRLAGKYMLSPSNSPPRNPENKQLLVWGGRPWAQRPSRFVIKEVIVELYADCKSEGLETQRSRKGCVRDKLSPWGEGLMVVGLLRSCPFWVPLVQILSSSLFPLFPYQHRAGTRIPFSFTWINLGGFLLLVTIKSFV